MKHDKEQSETESNDDASFQELFEELEEDVDDEFMSKYREQRLQQLAEDIKQVQKNVQNDGYGTLTTFNDENALMRLTSQTDLVVIHFFLNTFQKCKIMDEKLTELAQKHLMTRFLRISVEDSPFLVAKLNIKVLPCLVAYKNGAERDRIVGFSRLGNNPNDFSVTSLETILLECGILVRRAAKLSVLNSAKGLPRTSVSDDECDLDI